LHRWISCGLAAAFATPVLAAPTDPVALSAQVFVEQRHEDANGARRLVLTPVRRVTSGDRLVFVLRYRNAGTRPIANYVVTNALPAGVRLDGRLDASAARGIEVSADGGLHWGKPGALFARNSDGRLRPATLEQVTHVRWVAPAPIAPGATGQISYRGIVR
jgi:uncharacterized repeat protein (TIGR01451 family)